MTRTLGRQILLGYFVCLGATLMIVVVATFAMNEIAENRNQVLDTNLEILLDVHRLQEAVLEESMDVRAFLLTGDAERIPLADSHAGEVDELLATLDGEVKHPPARALLEQVRADYEAYQIITEEFIETRRSGATGAGIEVSVGEQLSDSRQALTDDIGEFLTVQQEHTDARLAAVEQQLGWALWLIWLVGLGAVALAVAVARWVTRGVSGRVGALAESIGTAVDDLLATTSQQVAGANEQASAVQQTVATTDQLTQSAEEASRRASEVAEKAQRSAEIAEDGRAAVASAVEGMAAVHEQAETTSAGILALADRAQAISTITDTVRDLADQTNVLALNASIEAARAGDEGRGFAVVAAEVRSLAEESQSATAKVASILAEIEQATDEAVLSTEQVTRRVAEGRERIEVAGSTIDELAGTIEKAAVAVNQIAAAAGQQAGATAQIGQAMRDVNTVVEQGLSGARQSEETARNLTEVAADLRALVRSG